MRIRRIPATRSSPMRSTIHSPARLPGSGWHWKAIEQVELPQILRDLNLSETHIKLVCALIVG